MSKHRRIGTNMKARNSADLPTSEGQAEEPLDDISVSLQDGSRGVNLENEMTEDPEESAVLHDQPLPQVPQEAFDHLKAVMEASENAHGATQIEAVQNLENSEEQQPTIAEIQEAWNSVTFPNAPTTAAIGVEIENRRPKFIRWPALAGVSYVIGIDYSGDDNGVACLLKCGGEGAPDEILQTLEVPTGFDVRFNAEKGVIEIFQPLGDQIRESGGMETVRLMSREEDEKRYPRYFIEAKEVSLEGLDADAMRPGKIQVVYREPQMGELPTGEYRHTVRIAEGYVEGAKQQAEADGQTLEDWLTIQLNAYLENWWFATGPK